MSLVMCHGKGEPDFVNLIRNGSFVDHADEWVIGFPGSELAFVGGQSRSVGSGALSLFRTGGDQCVALYRPGGARVISLNGLTTVDAVGYARMTGGTVNASAQLQLVFYEDQYGITQSDTVSVPIAGAVELTGAWDAMIARAIAVPDGATHVLIKANATTDDEPVLFDDVYLGAPGADAPPYTGAQLVPFPVNRIFNGEFEDGVFSWFGWWGTETLAHDTASPISGTGSFAITTPGGGTEQGAAFPDGNQIIVVPGESLRLSFRAKGSGEIKAFMDYSGASDATVWTGTLSGTPTLFTADFTVPVGAYNAQLLFATTTDQAITFTLDDVSLGTPQD